MRSQSDNQFKYPKGSCFLQAFGQSGYRDRTVKGKMHTDTRVQELNKLFGGKLCYISSDSGCHAFSKKLMSEIYSQMQLDSKESKIESEITVTTGSTIIPEQKTIQALPSTVSTIIRNEIKREPTTTAILFPISVNNPSPIPTESSSTSNITAAFDRTRSAITATQTAQEHTREDGQINLEAFATPTASINTTPQIEPTFPGTKSAFPTIEEASRGYRK